MNVTDFSNRIVFISKTVYDAVPACRFSSGAFWSSFFSDVCANAHFIKTFIQICIETHSPLSLLTLYRPYHEGSNGHSKHGGHISAGAIDAGFFAVPATFFGAIFFLIGGKFIVG